MNKKRVVVTGLGAITPLGNSVSACWDAARAGKSGIGPITRFDAAAFPTRFAGEVRNFDPAHFIESKEIKKLDLFSQFGLAAAQEALTQAKLIETTGGYDQRRMGCVIGVGLGGLTTLEKYHQAYLEGGPRKISPFLIPAMISNLAPGNIAIKFGLKGINYTVTSACTSSTHAIGEAARLIADGLQDVVVTGGTESTVTPIGIGGFCALKALSTRNEEPEKASRPFDKDRDGFVLAEGSAVLVLESYESAKARGAEILAEVKGYGFSCDAYHITAPCIDGAGAQECMKGALESAELKPENIQYINAHGTSTPANDSAETAAIKAVFGSYAKSGLLVSSTKSMTGHLLGAAGAIEAMFSVLALRDQVVPPTINLTTPDDACDLDYVPNTSRKSALTNVMSNSFGFGGTNSSVVFSKV